jgi:electron transfer flavoprotein alpha subunit
MDAAVLSAITAAKSIGDVTVLAVTADSADKAASVDGVANVLKADDAAFANGIAENITGLVCAAQEAGSYSHIMFTSDNYGKAIMPRVAVSLDVAPISDVMSIESEDTFTRPMYAGNAIATVQSGDAIKIMTVRGTAFEKAAEEGGSAAVTDAPAPASADAGLTQWASDEVTKSDRPELTAASVIISGGRGLKNGENFGMLEKVADKLGGAVGASRAAVDAGYVPNDMQIGQTGKVVAPDLYVAVGLSGAIQHLAGMKDSKTIVAINKDPEAPICALADYSLVEDLFKAVPEFEEKI